MQWLYFDLLQALKGEPLSSGFSTVGFLIFASSVPTAGIQNSDKVSWVAHPDISDKRVADFDIVNRITDLDNVNRVVLK